MRRWEYKTIKFEAEGFWQGGKIDATRLEAALTQLGAVGWELVTIVTATAGQGWTKDIVAVLKRSPEVTPVSSSTEN
ncbi:MAG: DUF4177 domain-containing protein [Zavarzinella sp.]